MSDVFERLKTALADRYTVEREVGSGGMAVVYLAHDLRHERAVAIKVLRPELTSVVAGERFLREIKLAAGLAHPNILPVHDSGEADGFLYYVMPYVEGESLRDELNAKGQLPIDEATRIAREVADALSYAHERKLLHRDIKPENILLAAGHAVVADFGIAKALSDAGGDKLTQTGITIGTPAYMSPEQAAGESAIDERSDIYSLACVLYEMLAGQPPFTGKTRRAVIAKQIVDVPAPIQKLRPSVSERVAQAIETALAKPPGDRFATARDFAQSLKPAREAAPRRIGLGRVLGLYAATSAVLLAVAYFLMLKLGLPGWFLTGAALALLVCLPIIVATALAQRTVAPAAAGGKAPRPPNSVRRWLSWRNAIGAGVASFAMLGVSVGGYMGMRLAGIGPIGTLAATGVIEPGERLVLSEFESQTGDTALALVVTRALRTGLSQSRFVQVATTSEVESVLERMERDPELPLDSELAREVAIREGVKAYIEGDVTSIGKRYVLSARLIAAESGVELANWSATAEEEDAIIDAIDRLGRGIRERAGESLKTVRESDPLAKVTTSSLEALRLYTVATEFERDLSIPLLEQAVAIDSTFAAAWYTLWIAHTNSRVSPASAIEAITRAYRLRDRLTERWRYSVTAGYHWTVTGDVDATLTARRALVQISDSSRRYLNNLALVYFELKDYESAERLLRRFVQGDTSVLGGNAWGNLLETKLRQGKLDEAERMFDELVEYRSRRPSARPWSIILYGPELSTYRGDFETAEARLQWGLADSAFVQGRTLDARFAWPASSHFRLGNLDLLQGKIAEARQHYAEALALEEKRDRPTARLYRFALAQDLISVWFGPADARTQTVEAVLERYPISDLHAYDRPYLELARFYALAGLPVRARELLSEYEDSIQLRAVPERAKHHRVTGIVALSERRLDEAIEELHRGDTGWCAYCAPRWLGQAYELAGNADSAIATYERYVTLLEAYRRTGDALPDGLRLFAHAYERLGALYEERGDTAKAIYYYGSLVDLWENADPELQPRVEAARRAIQALSPDRPLSLTFPADQAALLEEWVEPETGSSNRWGLTSRWTQAPSAFHLPEREPQVGESDRYPTIDNRCDRILDGRGRWLTAVGHPLSALGHT